MKYNADLFNLSFKPRWKKESFYSRQGMNFMLAHIPDHEQLFKTRSCVQYRVQYRCKKCFSWLDSLRGLDVKDSLSGLDVKDSLRGLDVKDSLRGLDVKDSLRGLDVKDSQRGLHVKDSLRSLDVKDNLRGLNVKDTLRGW